MNFFLIGVNHKTAPVEVRERLAIPEARLPEAVRQIGEPPGVDEAMIVSTCNRVEMIAKCVNGSCDLKGFLREFYRLEPDDYANLSLPVRAGRGWSVTFSGWLRAWTRWSLASRRFLAR